MNYDDETTRDEIEDSVVRAIFPSARRQPDGSWIVAPGVTVRNASVSISIVEDEEEEEEEVTDEAE